MRDVLGGLAGSLAALAVAPGLASAATPPLPKVTTLPGAEVLGPDPVTAVVGSALSSSALLGSDAATTPDDPTPAPTGAQYGATPETVIGGVPVEGTLNSVEGASAILPGSGPKDYA